MLKTVARFVEEPIWKKFGYYQFYWAKLANKEGEFGCSFGKKMLENYSSQRKVCLLKCEKGSLGFKCKDIEFLNDSEELTDWEELVVKKKNNQSDLQKENQNLKQQLVEALIELKKLKDSSSGQNNLEVKEKSHSCPYPSEYEESGKRYQENCIRKIKGKVLSTEIVPDKHENSGEECWKIRINEWKNLRSNKDYVIWYDPENYGKRPFRTFPEVEKTYWFFLHERKGINHEYNQHGWQWTHDWQLIKEKQDREREINPIFTENKPKQLIHCKYCANELKEIVYEIIEPDKTNYFERYFCPKCYKMFHFWESKPKSTKNKEESIEIAREEKSSNLNEKKLPKDRQEFSLFEEKLSKLTSSLNEEQKRIFYLAVQDRANLFFTGAAGTGKSFLLKKIITALELLHGQKKVAITALTGIAAHNIGGTTLHSFAGIGLGRTHLSELIQEIQKDKRVQKRWQTIEVLVVDEISMLSSDLLDKLYFLAKTIRNNELPFGGIQLIFSGDFFQLPPVAKNKNSLSFCFESQNWKKCFQHSILLTKIHRQSENRLIELLNEIRFGELSPTGLGILKELEKEPQYPQDDIAAVQLYATNEEINKVNSKKLAELPQQIYSYQAFDWEGSTKRLSDLLRHCLAPTELQLKIGAQVMLVKNLSSTFVNGSQGVVVGFREQECEVNDYSVESRKRKYTQRLLLPIVKFTNGFRKVIELAEWNIKIPYTNIIQASRQQIPLILSWAITIHKSQGQSIERLKIDCRNIFTEGQLYVALSRATSVKYLQVIGFDKRHVMLAHPKVNSFYQSLLEQQTKYETKDN